MVHKLKIHPQFFDAVANDIKPFEIRKNDRNFKVGDAVLLQEFDGETYTTRATQKVITYVLDDPQYCLCGYVILGLKGCDNG